MRPADTLAPRSTGVSVALAALALLVVATATATAAGSLAAVNVAALARGDVDTVVLAADRDALAIGIRNLGAIALLAAGAPLLGTVTVLAIALVGTGLGLSGAAVVAALGPAETIARVGPYIAFELCAVVLAAAAGLLPTVHAVIATVQQRRAVAFLPSYSRALRASLALTLVAAVLVVIAAAIEAVVIAAHPS